MVPAQVNRPTSRLTNFNSPEPSSNPEPSSSPEPAGEAGNEDTNSPSSLQNVTRVSGMWTANTTTALGGQFQHLLSSVRPSTHKLKIGLPA